jgi:aspartokinase/homoserine dehydrogenase 1
MRVLKFGGSSMGTADSIKRVKEIITGIDEQVHVVVSALGGTTDLLIKAANRASKGDNYKELTDQIYERHVNVANEINPGLIEEIKDDFEDKFSALLSLLKGISLTRELSPRSLDIVTGFGEQLSACFLHSIIDGSVYFDSRDYIKTVKVGDKNRADLEITGKLLKEAEKKAGKINVWPGFISRDINGDNTTLGRGGSDYTAAIIAAVLEASILEIWTDVDGFMSGDPRVIKRAYSISHLTYAEALELSHFGAKVIYPPTIIPVLQKNIPVLIKNTFNPDFPGTLIDNDNSNGDSKIKGVSSIRNIALITLQGTGMVGITGISMRFFSALAQRHINVVLISQASSENSITVAVETDDAKEAANALEYEFEREISYRQINSIKVEKDMAVVAIVGERMKHTSGVAGQLFRSIGANGINLYAIAQGASELNISFVIKDKDLRKALNVIHEAFFLINYQVLNIYLTGVGTVGANLLQKIADHSKKLKKQERVELRLVGVANSKKMVINTDGLPPAKAIDMLKQGEDACSGCFSDKIIGNNLANSVFVDCTASEDVSKVYKKLLNANVSVVTANKIASSSSYDMYHELRTIARQNGIKYLFETNVGAGLPIISTINNLINSGDRIIKLKAVLSGTLNFIVNELSAEKPLSAVIKEAMEKGYSEPDPRIDLSGMDVVRKILILARESGYKPEQEDIIKNSFIPAEYMEAASVDEFLEKVKGLDDTFEKQRQQLEKEGKRLRYVASFENGVAKTGFEEVTADSPLYNLEGSNNMLLVWSEYYKEHPMVIKGYGAGADVTAAGVFADIIRVVNV